jgi:hypothetical protein
MLLAGARRSAETVALACAAIAVGCGSDPNQASMSVVEARQFLPARVLLAQSLPRPAGPVIRTQVGAVAQRLLLVAEGTPEKVGVQAELAAQRR